MTEFFIVVGVATTVYHFMRILFYLDTGRKW